MISRSDTMPALWPSPRFMPRAVAHRPLPSMMHEMCLGMRARSRASISNPSGGSAKNVSNVESS